MNHYAIVKKLVGPIGAIGDSRIDAMRYANLGVMIGLVDNLISDISMCATDKDQPEASMAKSGRRAQDFLDILRDTLEEEDEH